VFIRGLLTLFCVLSLLKAETPLKKVTLQLSWFNQFQFAGYYIAKEKGFYKEEGIDVQIMPYRFGLNIPKSVANGQRDFGIGRETLLMQKARGLDIVALYALFQTSPLVFLSLKQSGIKSIDDFRGKTIMATRNDAGEVSLRAMLNSHGIMKGDYTYKEHTHNIEDLIDGKVDVVSAYTSKSPYELQRQGFDYIIHNPTDAGFDMYSDFLYTSKDFLRKNITVVNAFKRASLRGWEYAYNHIPESVNLILKKYNTQGLSKEALTFEAHELKKLSYFHTNKLGKIEKSKLQRIYDLYNVMGIIQRNVDLNDFVFNTFQILNVNEKSYLQKKKEIKFCSSPDILPFESIEEGKYIGIIAEYLQKIETQIDTPFSLISTKARQDALNNFQEKQCDILPLASSFQKDKNTNYTSAYIRVPLVVATKNNNIFIANFSDIVDKKLGVVKGFGLKKELLRENPSLQIVEVANTANGLQMVENSELYGLIDTLPSISYELQKNHMKTLKIAGKIDKDVSFSFALHKNDKELLRILEKALERLSEGSKQSVFSQWIHVKYEQGFDYTLFWKILAGIAILFFLLFLRYRVIHKYNKKIEHQLDIIEKYVLLSRTDTEGIITYVSEALCRATGYTKEELIGQSQSIFRHPDTPKEVFADMWDTIQSGKNWKGEFANLRKNGTTYWIEVFISPIFNKKGQIEGYSAFRYDITDKKHIEKLSITDKLTKVSNRLFLDNIYEKELNQAKRYGNIFSLIMVDIDYFKEVNDLYGHAFGDQVLYGVAQILQKYIRESDYLGRWGGEEFLIICPHTSSKHANLLAEKLRREINGYVFEKDIRKTCSFGISQYENGDQDLDTLQRADKALYVAKEQGRDQVVVS
jgi:polar amino acid transport system substrate-binding protein